MNRVRFASFLAGVLAAGLPAMARAEEAPASPAAAPSAPAVQSAPSASAPAPEGPGAAKSTGAAADAPTATPDPRDRQIEELRQAISALQKAVLAGQAQPVKDARDQQIEELKKVIEQLQSRVDELEKRPAAPPPAETPPTPPPTPGPTGVGTGGATFIPNISAIGNIVFGAGDTRRVGNRGRFNFDEFEIAFQDAVAPKLRYDVFLSAEKGEEWKVGMEEGFLTATALYPGLNARIGRIRVPFGKFNPLHSHVWPFITQPSVQAALLGPDGLISDGAVLEYTLPTKGFFVRGELGGWQTTSEAEDGLGFAAGELGAYSGRLWLGKELGRDHELELGFSRYQGRGDVASFGRRLVALNGVDLTYRAYPGPNQILKASAEVIDHQTDLPGADAHRLGGFAYLTYRMNKFWETGVRADYTRFAYPVDSYDWGGSLFLTKYITEQTSLRLEYQYANSPLLGSGSGIYFQILFGSGPHTHNLQ